MIVKPLQNSYYITLYKKPARKLLPAAFGLGQHFARRFDSSTVALDPSQRL